MKGFALETGKLLKPQECMRLLTRVSNGLLYTVLLPLTEGNLPEAAGGSMTIRAFRHEDGPALAKLAAGCQRGETDFVLNPLWDTEAELEAEFVRHGIDPEKHLLVAESGDGSVAGMAGFLRAPKATLAGLICPVVSRDERGQGLGGELLRAAIELGTSQLGIKLATAGIGTRNRSGYSLLTAYGFRPVRQHFLMRCDEKPAPPAKTVQGIELEPAGPGDVEAIHEIYSACGFETRTPERMRAIFEDGRHVHAVARHGDRVVAFAELETHWPRRVWVAFVGVSSDLRDRGVGSSLVAWTLAGQFDQGAESGLLMLSPANRTALRTYEKVGFRRFRLIDVLEKGF